MSSIEQAVNYFVSKKFGFVEVLASSMALINPEKTNPYAEEKSKINAYKLTLRNMPKDELLTLHKQSLEKDAENQKLALKREEEQRFYNLLSANADFEYWSKAAHWTLDEAVALSLGKEPDVVTWKKIEPLVEKTKFAKVYARRRELVLRASKWKKFGDLIPPVSFYSWAKHEVKIDLPSQLITELAKIGHTATNWREDYYAIKAKLDAIDKKVPDNTQKTENLLKAIACMAIDGYAFSSDARNDACKVISEALKSKGKPTDPKTIRTWIKEGLELLPRKPL